MGLPYTSLFPAQQAVWPYGRMVGNQHRPVCAAADSRHQIPSRQMETECRGRPSGGSAGSVEPGQCATMEHLGERQSSCNSAAFTRSATGGTCGYRYLKMILASNNLRYRFSWLFVSCPEKKSKEKASQRNTQPPIDNPSVRIVVMRLAGTPTPDM